MSVYVIAQIKFVEEVSYRRYQSRFADDFNRFSGRLFAADEHPVVLEGNWDHDKVVLMSFVDGQHARLFLESDEYLEISRDRKSGAQTTALLVQGL
jgi:uncharacterized protein (DUF1330 family)